MIMGHLTRLSNVLDGLGLKFVARYKNWTGHGLVFDPINSDQLKKYGQKIRFYPTQSEHVSFPLDQAAAERILLRTYALS
jgi:hypothetical protein